MPRDPGAQLCCKLHAVRTALVRRLGLTRHLCMCFGTARCGSCSAPENVNTPPLTSGWCQGSACSQAWWGRGELRCVGCLCTLSGPGPRHHVCACCMLQEESSRGAKGVTCGMCVGMGCSSRSGVAVWHPQACTCGSNAIGCRNNSQVGHASHPMSNGDLCFLLPGNRELGSFSTTTGQSTLCLNVCGGLGAPPNEPSVSGPYFSEEILLAMTVRRGRHHASNPQKKAEEGHRG